MFGRRAVPDDQPQDAVANAGDTIVVGPGRYGDVDGNGSLGDPGDEPSTCELPLTGGVTNDPVTCSIHVNKAVKIESRDAAAAAVIDIGETRFVTVGITAAASFGRANRGFTIRNGVAGVLVLSKGAKVGGNIAVNNVAYGFADLNFYSPAAEFSDNRSLQSESGFLIAGTAELTANVASDDEFGFQIRGEDGFPSPRPRLTGNLAVANQDGFSIENAAPAAFVGNAAIGNSDEGISIHSGSMPPLVRTAVYGNTNAGINSAIGVDANDVYWGATSGPRP